MEEPLIAVELLWVEVTRSDEQRLLSGLRAIPQFQDVQLAEWDVTQTWFIASLPESEDVLENAIEALLSLEGFGVEIQGTMDGPVLAVVFKAASGRGSDTVQPGTRTPNRRRSRDYLDAIGTSWAMPIRNHIEKLVAEQSPIPATSGESSGEAETGVNTRAAVSRRPQPFAQHHPPVLAAVIGGLSFGNAVIAAVAKDVVSVVIEGFRQAYRLLRQTSGYVWAVTVFLLALGARLTGALLTLLFGHQPAGGSHDSSNTQTIQKADPRE